jgi:hypothetical protein
MVKEGVTEHVLNGLEEGEKSELCELEGHKIEMKLSLQLSIVLSRCQWK